MSFIQFLTGMPRSGKTLLNACFVLLLADSGVKVHSNLSLFDKNGKGVWNPRLNGGLGDWSGKRHPNARVITPYDLIVMLEKGRRPSQEIIFLQEVYGWFNSHKSTSTISDLEDSFVFQSGKLNYAWYVDSQLTMRVGGSLRKLATKRFEAEHDEENQCFNYYGLDIKQPDLDIRTDEDSTLPYSIASMFWNRYDTYERSKAIGFAENKLKLAQTDAQLMNQFINEQVDAVFPKLAKYNILGVFDINVTRVKDILMQEGFPVGFASYVCERLKSKMRYN